MNFNINLELQTYLDKNEKLLWTGQPKRGIFFKSSDIFVIPFSLIWCGFAIFWVFMTASFGAPFFFTLFGVPFILIGLYIVFGRFIFDAKQRANTFYGLTEDRIIIKSGINRKTIKSLNIKALTDIEYSEKSDGSGTISFGSKNVFEAWNNSMSIGSGNKGIPSLEFIDDVRKVYNKIIEIQRNK